MQVRTVAGDALDPATLYGLLRLRAEVFVVEQRCCYLDLDGRDLDAATRHCFVAEGGRPVAALRLLVEPDGSHRIGRVATAAGARGRGLAATLVHHALGLAGRPVVLDAQAHLESWYEGFGFVAYGPAFVEDGIPHVPMRLR